MTVLAPTYTNFLAYSNAESAYWNNVTVSTGTTAVACDPGALQGSLCQVLWSRTEAAGVREDLALIDFHFSVATGANTAWAALNATDKAAVEAALDTWWTSLKARRQPHMILTGYTWRDYGADFPKGKTGLSKPGPINRQTTRSVAGTAVVATNVPDQAAMSVTFATASRRHWGRVYMPCPTADQINQYSRFVTGGVDPEALAFNTLLDTCSNLTRNVHLFIWNTRHPGQFAVSTLKIDDVPDVIRRRRPKVKTYEKRYGL